MTRTRPNLVPEQPFEDIYLSITVGLLSLKQSGLAFFARGGPTIRLYHKQDPILDSYNQEWLNLDIGLNYVIK